METQMHADDPWHSAQSPMSFNSCGTPVMHIPSAEIQAFLEASFNAAVPVGCTPADKDILVNAIYSAKQNNLDYLDILNSLHGTNGHVAAQWKDYYLAHVHEIDRLVSERITPVTTPVRGAKKPRFSSPSPTPSTLSLGSSDSEELPEFFTPTSTPSKVSQPRSPGNGVPFRQGELNKMAGYIATLDDWESRNRVSRWNGLSATTTPFRSPGAWEAHYRKRKDIIDNLVEQLLESHQIPTNAPSESAWGPPQQYPGDHYLEGSSYETGSTSSSETLSDAPSSDSD
ncbi:hypothetical protein PTI98_001168 [Pleurotus ostreatus]|nr:hypothetical protein PTI98_001168 [Pleurotus ostreatus]